MGSEHRDPWLQELLEGPTEPSDQWLDSRGAEVEAAMGRELYLKLKAGQNGAVDAVLKARGADVAALLLRLPAERFVNALRFVPLPELARELGKVDSAQRRTLSKIVDRELKDTSGGARLGLAACALCGLGAVKRVIAWEWHERFLEEAVFEVLSTRRPDWLEKWLEHELKSRGYCLFGVIRRLIRAGVCEQPTSESYYAALVRACCASGAPKTSLLDVLRADPELIDHALQAFELDPADGTLYEWAPAYFNAEQAQLASWGHAFTTLVREGRLGRERLMDAALSTLRARVQLRGTAFYLRLLDELALSEAELASRGSDYLDLLTHPISAVVKHALGALATLIKAGRAGEPYVSALASVFEAEPKGNALAALRLLRALGKQQPALRPDIAVAAAHGLQHANPDVQDKSLALLEESWDGAAQGPLAVARGYAALVAATNRARLEALLGAPGDPPGDADLADALAQLFGQARELPSDLAELADLPSLIAACEAGTAPQAYQPRAQHAPRLYAAARVQPIGSQDELIDALLAVMEDREDAVAFERCLDGISRHAGTRPADFETRTAALLARAAGEHESRRVRDLAALICCWIRREPKPRTSTRYDDWFDVFFALRTTEIAQRAKDNIHAATLSLPTHSQGWVAPSALVERVRAAQRDDIRFMQADFVQALLRLAPDGRQAALSAAADLQGEMGSALRYALGAEFAGVGSHPHYWAAAARARHVAGPAPELAHSAADAGPFGAFAVEYDWELRPSKHWAAAQDEHRLRLAVRPAPEQFPGEAYFPATTALRDVTRRPNYFAITPLEARLYSMAWPMLPESAFWLGAHAISDRLFRPASSYMATSAFLEPLFDPDLPFLEPAQVCVALALIAQDADARTTAADVATTLMEDGRCDGSELGAVLARMRGTTDGVRLGRVAESLSRVQVAGPAQQWACARCLETLLVGLGTPLPKDAHHLLELLAELNTALNRPCPAALEGLLSSIKGAGKAAKAAARILKQPGSLALPAAVATQLLRARIDRVQRWASAPVQ